MTKKGLIQQIRDAEVRVASLHRDLQQKTGVTEDEGRLLTLLGRIDGWTNHIELKLSNPGMGYTKSGKAVRGLKRKGLIDYVREGGVRFRINAHGREKLKVFKQELP